MAGNVERTIADLTETLEIHEDQLNIVLGKLNNLQTRMNTVTPRTKKMDKEFSHLDSKLESYKRKSQANELLTNRNRELILSMDKCLTQLEGIVSEQDPCRCKPSVTADEDLDNNYFSRTPIFPSILLESPLLFAFVPSYKILHLPKKRTPPWK